MERAIQLIADLIEHLKLEGREQETRCFYCGGPHKTIDCSSHKREEFLKQILEIDAKSKKARQIAHMSQTPSYYDELLLNPKKYPAEDKIL